MSREFYSRFKVTSLDYETHLIKPGCLAPIVVCGSTDDGVTPQIMLREDALNRTRELLDDGTTLIAGANIAYDFGCYLRHRPDDFERVWRAYELGRIFDVQIAATLDAIFEGRLQDGELFLPDGKKIRSGRYSLDLCAQQFLGRGDAKRNDEYRLRYAELDGKPLDTWPEAARQYPLDDATNTRAVAIQQIEICENLQDLAAQTHTALCLQLGAIHGLRADSSRVEAFALRVNSVREALKNELFALGIYREETKKGEKKLVKNTKLVRDMVSTAYNGAEPVTEKGATSISRQTLKESGDDVLKKLAEQGRYDKLATYIPTLQEAAAVRLNPRANVLLASGRCSYEGLIQLMPREGGIRECFKFDGIGSSVDYSAIEMAGLAEVQYRMLGRSKLGDAINSGLDIHSLLGAQLCNCTYDAFMRDLKTDKTLKNYRQAAKAGNFGFPGMMGEARFVHAKQVNGESVCEWFYNDGKCREQIRLRSYKGKALETPLCSRCIERARDLRNEYVRMWPEMQPYWDRVTHGLRSWGDKLPQYVSGRIRGGLTAPAGANTLFQGIVADGAKAAVRAITKECYTPGTPLFGGRVVIFAHDETIMDLPGDLLLARAAAERQAELMVTEMRRYLTKVKVVAEPALMRYWYKEAETVRNEKGELEIWEPKN